MKDRLTLGALAVGKLAAHKRLRERAAQHDFVVSGAHIDGKDIEAVRLVLQCLNTFRHCWHVGQIVAGTPKKAFWVAEIVLHVDDDKGGMSRVDAFVEAEYAPLAHC